MWLVETFLPHARAVLEPMPEVGWTNRFANPPTTLARGPAFVTKHDDGFLFRAKPLSYSSFVGVRDKRTLGGFACRVARRLVPLETPLVTRTAPYQCSQRLVDHPVGCHVCACALSLGRRPAHNWLACMGMWLARCRREGDEVSPPKR